MISKILAFLQNDIWRIRSRDLPRFRSFLIKPLRIFLLAYRGFDEDKCQLRASALTFYSLLSIVPVLAMAFGIAKGFGFDKILQNQLLEKIPGQEAVMVQVINFSYQLLENTKGGLVAGIGVALLFWTVIKVLSNIEKSFNDIWGVKQNRTLGRRFSDYLSVMLLCPILFIVASSVTVFLAAQIQFLVERVSFLGFIAPAIIFLIQFIPYCVLWILFSFIYIFMPNTKVRFSSGVLAGIVAGTIYQVVQWAYVGFQIGVAKYNAIYGGFAALPLFLAWLQVSWLVVLFGAEISFAHQNVDMYEFEPDSLRASLSFKKILSLSIAQRAVKNFSQGKRPFSASRISHELEIPIRLVRQIIFELVEGGILAEVTGTDEKETGYQPARDIAQITIHSVINALEDRGIDNIPVLETDEFKKIKISLAAFNRLIDESPENKTLAEI